MRESMSSVAAVFAYAGLLTRCNLVPLLLTRYVSPLLGVMSAVFCVVPWLKLVPTGPGFMQGIVAVWGLIAAFATLVACAIGIFLPAA